MTPVHWPFTNHIENFFMGMSIIFDTWTHADDDSPGGVWSENEDWVVDSSELRVDSGLHLVPRVELERVVGHWSTEILSRVSVESVALRKLRLVVLTIWLNKRFDMPQGCSKSILELLKDREVWSRLHLTSNNRARCEVWDESSIQLTMLLSNRLDPLKCLLKEHILEVLINI